MAPTRSFWPLAGLAMLAACGQASEPSGGEAAASDRVVCAVAGASRFGEDCRIERQGRTGSTMFVIRHEDGGFRRLSLLADGTITAADGADPARVSRAGDTIQIAIDVDRYRLKTNQITDGR